MTAAALFTVRAMRAEDLPGVVAIEEESPSPWSMLQFGEELAREDGWQFVALDISSGELAGFILGRLCLDEAELLKIATAKAHRRQGAAAILLGHAMRHLADKGAARCFLELRAGNLPALALYENFAFRRVGSRKNYYHSPPEEALLMARAVSSGETSSSEGKTP